MNFSGAERKNLNMVGQGLAVDELVYEASAEQMEYWTYGNNPAEKPQQLSLDFLVEDSDEVVIARTIEMMVRRHESLRTYFRLIEGVVKQCVLPYSSRLFSPLVCDVSGEADVQQAILDIKKSPENSFTNLSTAPLFKSCVIKCSNKTYFVSVAMHHAISDAYSVQIMYNELIGLYNSLRMGTEIDASEKIMQLGEYTKWQKKWLEANGAAARQYWTEVLGRYDGSCLFDRLFAQEKFSGNSPSGSKGGIFFRAEREIRNIKKNSKTGQFVFQISGAEFAQVLKIAAYCNATIFSVVISSVQLLFYMLACKRPVLISSPFASRIIPGTERVIGCLVATVYLYKEVDQGWTVGDFVKECYMDLMQSCMYPIYNHDLQLEKGLHYHTDIFLNFKGKDYKIKKSIGEVAPIRHFVEDRCDFFDLVFRIDEFEDGLSCNWTYNTSLYTFEMMEFVLRRYKEIISLMSREIDMSIEEFGALFCIDQSKYK